MKTSSKYAAAEDDAGFGGASPEQETEDAGLPGLEQVITDTAPAEVLERQDSVTLHLTPRAKARGLTQPNTGGRVKGGADRDRSKTEPPPQEKVEEEGGLGLWKGLKKLIGLPTNDVERNDEKDAVRNGQGSGRQSRTMSQAGEPLPGSSQLNMQQSSRTNALFASLLGPEEEDEKVNGML